MTRRSLAQFLRCRRGASAVEFGIVSVPLILLMFGAMEFGRALWTREALQEIAIAGARCMGLVQSGCGTAGVYNATMATSYVVAEAAKWSIPLTGTNMTLNASATCAGVGGFSQVQITYGFMSVVPKLIPALAGTVSLSATACFPNHA